jgi:predicted ester cyclase
VYEMFVEGVRMDRPGTDVIRAAVGKLNAGDADGYLANFQPECLHWVSGAAEPMPMPQFVESMQAMRTGMPDLHIEEVNLFAVDNFVCAQWRTRGTHTAELFGMPPTQRAVCFDAAEVYELDVAGLVRTSWAFGDPAELFRQLSSDLAGVQS